MGFFEALRENVHEWCRLIRSSTPCGVEITRLKDCTMTSRVVFCMDAGQIGLRPQNRLVLWDARLRLFIEIAGSDAELQALGREVAIRQAVDSRATCGGTFLGQGSVVDPRCMSLEQ